VHSKANSSQPNLPHCTITEKDNDKKLKNKNEKSQKYRKHYCRVTIWLQTFHKN